MFLFIFVFVLNSIVSFLSLLFFPYRRNIRKIILKRDANILRAFFNFNCRDKYGEEIYVNLLMKTLSNASLNHSRTRFHLYITMRHENLPGCNFCMEMYFSNFRRKIISAPYLPEVPLSTKRK